jgi:hypothetical protein
LKSSSEHPQSYTVDEYRWYETLVKPVPDFIPSFVRAARYRFFGTYVNRESEICDILRNHWIDFRTDLYPKDRRMRVLEEKGVRGMSSENVRFVVNELVRRFAKEGTYLEVGSLQGCSLLSAALYNPTTRVIGIDNFCQFDPKNSNESLLKENLMKFDNPKNIGFYNRDYKEAVKCLFDKEPHLKIDIYYYDGPHSFRDQVEGLEIMLPHLAEDCIVLVDDLNWTHIAVANKNFIRRNPDFRPSFRILTKGMRSKDWWNGFEVITRGL